VGVLAVGRSLPPGGSLWARVEKSGAVTSQCELKSGDVKLRIGRYVAFCCVLALYGGGNVAIKVGRLMVQLDWSNRVSNTEAVERAGGRRRLNAQRKRRVLARRERLIGLLVAYGGNWQWGVKSKVAHDWARSGLAGFCWLLLQSLFIVDELLILCAFDKPYHAVDFCLCDQTTKVCDSVIVTPFIIRSRTSIRFLD